MGNYGLKIFDVLGDIEIDLIDRITRLRHSKEVGSGVSSNMDLSDISGLSSVQISVSTDAVNTAWNKCSHKIERAGTILTWTAQSGTWYSSANSLIFCFLYT